ncbi:unnamed protein product [Medioppia subpectinata]|uniref:Uncharacterized protein n=1 Tax=Medioppia subpectinata TaxID=1979941 RepID=A0A7R9LLL8_9ACAR|nr:unnamed protein product [Medioppia subpectinata]CAG2119890.1 unnamed protein product [Medioppia subpectinata]
MRTGRYLVWHNGVNTIVKTNDTDDIMWHTFKATDYAEWLSRDDWFTMVHSDNTSHLVRLTKSSDPDHGDYPIGDSRETGI